MLTSQQKNQSDLKQRLKICWRRVYRNLKKLDEAKTGMARLTDLVESLHQNKCFVSREELTKLLQKYRGGPATRNFISGMAASTDTLTDHTATINYELMTKEMGLHNSYLELIQKNQLDAISRSNLQSIHSSQKDVAASRYKQFFRDLKQTRQPTQQKTAQDATESLSRGTTLPALQSSRHAENYVRASNQKNERKSHSPLTITPTITADLLKK